MHLIQLALDITKGVRHLKPFMGQRALGDDSLVIKTVLTEAFSGPFVRPWAVHSRLGPVITIVGYARDDAATLNKRRALALPTLQAATSEAFSVRMPDLAEGETYSFTVKLVPSVRVTANGKRRHGERDAFLAAVEEAGPDSGLEREGVYREYLKSKLSGAEVLTCRLEQFRLLPFTRPKQEGHGQKTLPEAVLSGTLKVASPHDLADRLSQGIGRQRAYGYGMVRLGPLTCFLVDRSG